MRGAEIAVGSRGSTLALAQARLVVDALERQGHRSRIVIIETEGDRRAPDTAWGEGAFVAAIERALLAGRVDIAVHSAKDIPTDEDPRLHTGAFLPRADPRDGLLVRKDAKERRLSDLPAGSRVGTDSPRRTGFLLARRPDLVVHPLHGNVDTRLRRLDEGETDALVLACAGLDRMGLGDRIAERLDADTIPPAPGQGAIAVQVRSNDAVALALTAAIDDPPTRLAVEAERAFLNASGGGCRSPIGALASIDDGLLDLLGGYASPDGSFTAVMHRSAPVMDGAELARELAEVLDFRGRSRPTDRRVLVTRSAGQADGLVAALSRVGLDPVPVPTIAVELEPGGGDLDAAARYLGYYSWVVITSTNGARAILKAAERVFTPFEASRFAAIGSASRRALEVEGVDVDFQPSQGSSAALAAELPMNAGDRVLIIRGDLADHELADNLRARGAEVDDVIAYRTREALEASRQLLRRAVSDGSIATVVFTSGSTVRGLLALGRDESIDVLAWPCVCIGPETAEEARTAGFRVLAVAATPDAPALAEATAWALAPQLQEIS